MPDETPPSKLTSHRASGPIAAVSIASIATALGLGALQLLDPVKAGSLPEALGTVPGWITSGGIMGILGLLIYWQLGNKKIGVDSTLAVNVDRADIRDHYAGEVASLRNRIDEQAQRHGTNVAAVEERYKGLLEDAERRYKRAVAEVEEHYRKALDAAEQRHEDCLADRDKLRDVVNELKDEVAGLRRQFATASSDQVISLGRTGMPAPSTAVLESAYRVKDIHQGEGGDSGNQG